MTTFSRFVAGEIDAYKSDTTFMRGTTKSLLNEILRAARMAEALNSDDDLLMTLKVALTTLQQSGYAPTLRGEISRILCSTDRFELVHSDIESIYFRFVDNICRIMAEQLKRGRSFNCQHRLNVDDSGLIELWAKVSVIEDGYVVESAVLTHRFRASSARDIRRRIGDLETRGRRLIADSGAAAASGGGGEGEYRSRPSVARIEDAPSPPLRACKIYNSGSMADGKPRALMESYKSFDEGGFTLHCLNEIHPRYSVFILERIASGKYAIRCQHSGTYVRESCEKVRYTSSGGEHCEAYVVHCRRGSDKYTQWILEHTRGGNYRISIEGRNLWESHIRTDDDGFEVCSRSEGSTSKYAEWHPSP